jgi:hypothetical protein
VRGCGNARILRDDRTEVVRFAGSDAGPLLYIPRNRMIFRRMSHVGRAKYAADMLAHMAWLADRRCSEAAARKTRAAAQS